MSPRIIFNSILGGRNESPVSEEASVEEKSNNSKELENLISASHHAIYEAKAVFPFDLFPNKVTIYQNRVTLSYKNAWSVDEFPIQIENVTGARVYRNFWFSSLTIDTFGYKDPPDPIMFLRNDDARNARRYILALMECKKSKIDISNYSIEELRTKLLDLGMVRKSMD